VWVANEGNKDVGALAWCDKCGASNIGSLALKDGGSGGFEGIPMMDISRGFRRLVGNENCNIMSRQVANDV
jgi:hypothetical protein